MKIHVVSLNFMVASPHYDSLARLFSILIRRVY